MAGNVWEWTRSLYGDYPYPSDLAGRRAREEPEQDGPRVVRGGSWGSYQGPARCAFRLRLVPDYFDGSLGLRVVVSLSNSDF